MMMSHEVQIGAAIRVRGDPAHLAVTAVVLTILRSRLSESILWEKAKAANAQVSVQGQWRELFTPRYLKSQFGGGFGAQSFFQLWSAELFPTLLRATAQGLTFAVVRIGLGLWSFFVPALTATGFTTLAWILTSFLVASGVVGLIWAPRHEGKSLEDIQRGSSR
jgi:hypothetical protein